jgi:hypothetical protein
MRRLLSAGLFAIALVQANTDDDWIDSPVLPFCRKGHAAIKGYHNDQVITMSDMHDSIE